MKRLRSPESEDNHISSQQRGKGASKKERRRERKAAAANGPEMFDETCWEEPREVNGLELVGEKAIDEPGWSYVVEDESRRCFLGWFPDAMLETCEDLFKEVHSGVDWQSTASPMGLVPRKTAWMVRDGCLCDYRFGKNVIKPAPFPDWIVNIMHSVMPRCGVPCEQDWPDSCTIDLFEEGKNSVGWHAVDENLFQGKFRDACLIMLALGDKRSYEFRLNWPRQGEKSIEKLVLGSGDLLTMEGMFQKHFQHRLPKQSDFSGSHITVCWRWICKHQPKCRCARQNR